MIFGQSGGGGKVVAADAHARWRRGCSTRSRPKAAVRLIAVPIREVIKGQQAVAADTLEPEPDRRDIEKLKTFPYRNCLPPVPPRARRRVE